MGKKEFVGLALDGEILRVARVVKEGKTQKLVQLDNITLFHTTSIHKTNLETRYPEHDSIFGINNGNAQNKREKNSANLEQVDILSMMDDPDISEGKSNETILYDLMQSIDQKKVNLTLNVPIGSTTFHILKDEDYQRLSKKELNQKVINKINSLYGTHHSKIQYNHETYDNGALVLSTTDVNPVMLDLIEDGKSYYNGKVTINDILSDETVLLDLIKMNYDLNDYEISCVIIFGRNSVRLMFLQGDHFWSVTPIINKGILSPQILSVIFSKILWQMDTGEVPNLDRIIITNNLVGEKVVKYFEENFPGVRVDDFQFSDKFIEIDPAIENATGPFTTAIGLACAGANIKNNFSKSYSFLPDYVHQQQNIFQLHWHGLLLLALIAITPLVLNLSYHNTEAKRHDLIGEIKRTESRINQLNDVVMKSRDYKMLYEKFQNRLNELQDLNTEGKRWSSALNIINNGFKDINSCWITALRSGKKGTIIYGYSLYRDRIPKLTRIFKNAKLQSVQTEKVRTKTIYKFKMVVYYDTSDVKT